MTYTELKNELYYLRQMELALNSKRLSLATRKDEIMAELDGGVVDYSKDNVQTTPDPDARINDAIFRADRAIATLLEEIKVLEDKTEKYEALVIKSKGIKGEILRLFFVEGKNMRQIAARLNYVEKYAWQLWRQGIEDLLEEVNNE